MARPRKYKLSVPGLYCNVDPRTNIIYWRYKHPLTGKFHGLGSDADEAKSIAIEANIRLSEQRLRNTLTLQDKIGKKTGASITVISWLDKYSKIQHERIKQKEISEHTVKQRVAPVNAMKQALGTKQISEVTTRDIVDLIEGYKDKGYSRMAQVVRTTLIDVFREAQHAGEVPPGYNPAEATKKPYHKITRERLMLDEFQQIYDLIPDKFRYMRSAMLLALITGQRESDISNMEFSDIRDDYLHVIQIKTGMRLAFPLALRCDDLGMSLREVVNICRDNIVSQYLVHYTKNTSQSQRGGKVSANTISSTFKKLRDISGIECNEGRTPVTFHEIRSLAERLYKKQGLDPKQILGHKSQRQTDRYDDIRDKDWIKITYKSG